MKFYNKYTGEMLSGKQGCCGACHRNFSSQTSFDAHRVGPPDERRCADPQEVGLVLDGYVWKQPAPANPHWAGKRNG